jgi:hypothetical protein
MFARLYRMFRLLLCAAVCGIFSAAAVTYRPIYYMTDVQQQPGGIIEAAPGLFYFEAGQSSSFISVTAQGAATTLASFSSGYILGSEPVTGANGLVYASVEYVENSYYAGNVFSVARTEGSLKNYATLSLIPSYGSNLPDSRFLGIVYNSSNFTNNLGTGDLLGNVTTLYQFPSTAEQPAMPIYAADGNYYGISFPHLSGSTDYFYRVTPSGSFTMIASLPFAGTTTFSGGGRILQATDGNFYGIQPTDAGCSASNQHGAVFKLTPTGQYTLLHDFGVCGNAVVDSLIQGSDGKLYGAVEGNSVLFSLTTAGTYKEEFRMNGSNGLCPCILEQASDGIIYGTSDGGGPKGYGLIFAFDAGLPVPKPRAQHFHPASGPVGTPVRIWGYNLLHASVQFNGVTATAVHNAGPNYVWATVPVGATTGPITVTTPGGSVTTTATFAVQ